MEAAASPGGAQGFQHAYYRPGTPPGKLPPNIETRIPDVLIIGQNRRRGQFFEGVKWVEIV